MTVENDKAKKIERILRAVKAPMNHPLFYPRVFALVSRLNKPIKKHHTPLEEIRDLFAEDYDELSRYLDRSEFQESCSVRNIMQTRRLATVLISDKGDLNIDLLPAAIQELKKHMYSLGPSRQYDAKRHVQILKVLTLLKDNKDLQRAVKKISKPFSHKQADDLIRETLQLSHQVVLTDAHAKRTVLSAWLCTLRQNVGSCFATAPAEVVHDEQPEQFLQDLSDLLATGRLKRTFGGIEYAVPLSSSWGNGDLKKPILMESNSKGFKPEIWNSLGLIAAFEAADFFKPHETVKPHESIKNKITQIKNWIEPWLYQKSTHYPYFVITAEEIIRTVMLQILGLTEQNIQDYESRPRAMIQSLMMQVPHRMAKGSTGVGDRSSNFLFLFEMAKNAFKGLTENALLKSWEFTLASLSETKQEFTQWNLYASLGMGTDEPGGIGQCIYRIIQQKLDIVNRRVQDLQHEYEIMYPSVKALESRLRTASTEKELQWIRVEYQTHSHELYTIQEMKEIAQAQAGKLVNLYDGLHTLYRDLFKDYFQEVYDSDMQEITTGPFDDSPAGFRLLYKHGRSSTSQWSPIKTPGDFIEALASFFSMTEPQIASMFEKEGVEKELTDVVTSIISHIRTKEFLETAFHRMAIAHRTPPIADPLNHLDQIEKKPWAYTSGGTMKTLVSTYFRLHEKPKEVSKWVENELELLVFLADTLKHIPQKLMEPYLNGSRTSMLVESPTHAFLLKPLLQPFKEMWTNQDYTYTYIRDRLVKPAEQFVETLILNDEMIGFIVEQLIEEVQDNYKPRFREVFSRISGPLNVIFFREFLVDNMLVDRGLNYKGTPVLAIDKLDSFLYSHLPLFPTHELKDRVRKILTLLPGIDAKQSDSILALFDQIPLSKVHSVIGSNELQDICKSLICLSGQMTSSPYDYHLQIKLAAQKLGYAFPMPVIFADTNWVKDDFAFVVNPGTGRLELWRTDYTGSVGYPMSSWKQWLDGSRTDLRWGVYVNPIEYGQH